MTDWEIDQFAIRRSPANTPRNDISNTGARKVNRPPAGAASRKPVLAAGGLVALMVVQLALSNHISDGSVTNAARFALVFAAAALGLVAWQAPAGLWSAPAAYLLLIEVFSLGLCPMLAFGSAIPTFGLSQSYFEFLNESTFPYVLLVATYGTTAVALGAVCAALISSRNRKLNVNGPESERSVPVKPDAPPGYLASAGLGILIVSLLLFSDVLRSGGGFALAVGPYSAFLSATAGSGLMVFVDLGLAIAVALLAADSPCPARRAGFSLYFIFALVALPLGLRSEIMFPAVVAGVIISKRRRIVSTKTTLLLIFLTMIAIGLLRDVRQNGVLNLNVHDYPASPTRGLAEMGLSILPLSMVVNVHAAGSVPFIHGASYLAPITRPIEHYLLHVPTLPAHSDDRLFTTFVQHQIGNAGGLPTAEAYHDFGAAGVWVVLGLTGFLLGLIDRTRARRWSQAWAAILFAPIVIASRNDFTPVPVQLLIGASVVGALQWWSRARSGNRRQRDRDLAWVSNRPRWTKRS